jgi:hypothetical protein
VEFNGKPNIIAIRGCGRRGLVRCQQSTKGETTTMTTTTTTSNYFAKQYFYITAKSNANHPDWCLHRHFLPDIIICELACFTESCRANSCNGFSLTITTEHQILVVLTAAAANAHLADGRWAERLIFCMIWKEGGRRIFFLEIRVDYV